MISVAPSEPSTSAHEMSVTTRCPSASSAATKRAFQPGAEPIEITRRAMRRGYRSRVCATRHTFARKDIWRALTGVTSVARMTALLLAEPEAIMRGFLERQLRSDGFDVLSFPSARDLPRAAQPDVFVLG